MIGVAGVLGLGILGLFVNLNQVYVALVGDIVSLCDGCGIMVQGVGKILFICFDLVGGVNIVGFNVLVGQQGGQEDFISMVGYSKMGLLGDMVLGIINFGMGVSEFIDCIMGLLFYFDSVFGWGICEKVLVGVLLNVDGVVIFVCLDNDIGNNFYNFMYGIWWVGVDGELLILIGFCSFEFGGNFMFLFMFMDILVWFIKVDCFSDVIGMVDIGKLVGMLDQVDVVNVMEFIVCISEQKMVVQNIGIVSCDEVICDMVNCGYIKSVDLVDWYGNLVMLDLVSDFDIVGVLGIFFSMEFNDNEF